MQRQRGFTLLEIMVVIVILGILASLVVPNLMGNKEKADRQKVVSDLVALEGALDMYKLDNSRYPNTEQGLAALVSRPAAEPQARNYPEGGYIRRLPQDPWATTISCSAPANTARSMCLASGRTACRIPTTISATGISGKNSAAARLHVTGDDAHFAADGR